MTIDDLINGLEAAKEKHGGKSTVFIKDPDTGYHMKVIGVRESNNEPENLLIIAEDYADYFSIKD